MNPSSLASGSTRRRAEAGTSSVPAAKDLSASTNGSSAQRTFTPCVQQAAEGHQLAARVAEGQAGRVALDAPGRDARGLDRLEVGHERRVDRVTTSTPRSSGNVCAVTSYGRLGGPPSYSRRSG